MPFFECYSHEDLVGTVVSFINIITTSISGNKVIPIPIYICDTVNYATNLFIYNATFPRKPSGICDLVKATLVRLDIHIHYEDLFEIDCIQS